MKASEMTNEELAEHIECGDAILREAAARLRRPTPVDDDLLKMARDIDAKDAEIAELRLRLKVAKDFATEMKQSANSLVRVCGHQMILILQGEGGKDAH